MEKPQKTFSDYVAAAISPMLIMLLVGSLAQFLIQVFYRGDMIQGVRWVMCWFVLAIVLVSRIGIERGKLHAWIYGALLAIATWIYLAYSHKLPVLGMFLLAVIWGCAYWLTIDCTVVHEAGDGGGDGMFPNLLRTVRDQFAPRYPESKFPPLPPIELLAAAEFARRNKMATERRLGRSVIWFSLAALPLFGIGQLFLPADDPHARRVGFAFLVLYLIAAFSLLVTTSFLGLRGFLRQRSVEIPAGVTRAWIRFGVFLAGGVLLVALVLPRPGATSFWKHLTYRTPHKEHKASDTAPPFNVPGEGEGNRTTQPTQQPHSSADSRRTPSGGGAGKSPNNNPGQSTSQTQPDQSGSNGGGGAGGQGTSGDGGNSDSSPPPANGRITLKDSTPNGPAEEPSESRPSNGPDQPEKEPRDGSGHQPAVKQSQNQNQPGKVLPKKETKKPEDTKPQDKQDKQPEQPQPQNSGHGQKQPSDILRRLLRAAIILALAALLIWLLIRYRKAIAAMFRALVANVREFFRKLFRRRRRKPAVAPAPVSSSVPMPESFHGYGDPFVTGKANTWPREYLVRYTYEALRAWAKEQGIEIKPQQTPREFCARLVELFPDIGAELEQFSFYASHAAFAKRLPDDFETDSIRRLWQYFGNSMAVAEIQVG